MTDESPATGHPYEIVSVRRGTPPAGEKSADWHHYVIAQGSNTIHGSRQGDLKTVTGAVKEIVAQLNERQSGKRGRVNLIPTPKKKTPK